MYIQILLLFLKYNEKDTVCAKLINEHIFTEILGYK